MQKKLRIAIVCDAIDDDSLGGSFISWKRFGAGLAKAGHSIIWITSKFKDINKTKDFAYAKVYQFPHTPRLWPYGVYFAYTSASRLSKIFEQDHIDIIYSIQPSIIARQAVRAAKKLSIPIVSHSHTLPEYFIPWMPRWIQILIKKFVAYMYSKYDGLVSPTKFLQKKYDDCGFTMKQIVIGNGVDTKVFFPLAQKPSDIYNILYVGRLDGWKNISVLIQALHLLRLQKKLKENIRCTIVGWWNMEKKLRALVSEYMLWDVIQFIGTLPANSLPLVKSFQYASVFVLPSLYETEGMVVLEAMACGCPLLVAHSPTSAAKDFVHNNGYTFDPYDSQDLADKIYQMSTNPQLCELMGKISQEGAKKFSFTLSIQKLEWFFHSLIDYK